MSVTRFAMGLDEPASGARALTLGRRHSARPSTS